jgi:hypothetical protein
LECILGILCLAEHTPADAENHGPVPFYERFHGGFVSLGKEAFQQLPIVQISHLL